MPRKRHPAIGDQAGVPAADGSEAVLPLKEEWVTGWPLNLAWGKNGANGIHFKNDKEDLN